MPSPSATRSRKSTEARKPRAPAKVLRSTQAVWPLLIFIILDPVIVRAASILALEGSKGFTLLYPWVEFLQLPLFHFTGEMVSRVTQRALYLQFPVYGLVMAVTYRADRKLRALSYALLLHLCGILLVVLFAYY